MLVTGHTGFKGAWLSEWLLALGADVSGLALPPTTQPALFEQLGLADRMRHRFGDVRDFTAVRAAMDDANPEVIMHLAAQPLVRLSYREPVTTFATNVMGTVHVLEAARQRGRRCNIVVVTTDKCYENREWLHSYREEDPMGGHDPYSASKGATELAVAAYRRSFFSAADGVRVATARAGNVLGGGDWALDRIVPDCIRALLRKQPVTVRNKVATRPWQHVLEPLSGYLWLGVALARPELFRFPADAYAGAFNFGPALASNRSVAELVQEVLKHWDGEWEDRSDPAAVHEACLLNLAIDKAQHLLGWQPVWDFRDTIRRTIEWYRSAEDHQASAPELTRVQIDGYVRDARGRSLAWAQ